MRPWKLLTARENLAKSVRESHFSFREKSPKKTENGFHGHFWFSREKKTMKKNTQKKHPKKNTNFWKLDKKHPIKKHQFMKT